MKYFYIIMSIILMVLLKIAFKNKQPQKQFKNLRKSQKIEYIIFLIALVVTAVGLIIYGIDYFKLKQLNIKGLFNCIYLMEACILFIIAGFQIDNE